MAHRLARPLAAESDEQGQRGADARGRRRAWIGPAPSVCDAFLPSGEASSAHESVP